MRLWHTQIFQKKVDWSCLCHPTPNVFDLRAQASHPRSNLDPEVTQVRLWIVCNGCRAPSNSMSTSDSTSSQSWGCSNRRYVIPTNTCTCVKVFGTWNLGGRKIRIRVQVSNSFHHAFVTPFCTHPMCIGHAWTKHHSLQTVHSQNKNEDYHHME